jgi:hypothetical protein
MGNSLSPVANLRLPVFPVVSSSLCVLCELCVSVVKTSLDAGY